MKKMVFCYDFDKTLTQEDTLDFGLCKALGIDPISFWKMEEDLMNNGVSRILTTTFLAFNLSKQKQFNLSRKNIYDFGKNIQFFDGVEEWFEMINAFAKQYDIEILHYVISGGLLYSIEGCSIYKHLKKVYACKFLFDKNDNPIWPARIIDMKNKPHYIQRIMKKEQIEAKDVIYFGDGATDIPAFEFVANNQGISIAVQHPQKNKEKELIEMLDKKTLHHYLSADYTKESELTKTIQQIIVNKANV